MNKKIRKWWDKSRCGKKIFAVMLPVLTGIAIIGTTVSADGVGRKDNIKSKGNFDYANGKAAIYSSDLTYLADEIDELEKAYKTNSVTALNKIGTYYMLDGSITHNAAEETLSAEYATNLSFNDIYEGILKSQSVAHLADQQAVNGDGTPLYYADESAKNDNNLVTTTTTANGFPLLIQPATADNLTAGTAAWVDGSLLIGNGADNQAYYNMGYTDGYNKVMNGASIKYTYHQHIDGNDNPINKSTVYSDKAPGGCYKAAGHTHNATSTCTVSYNDHYSASWRNNIDAFVCPTHGIYGGSYGYTVDSMAGDDVDGTIVYGHCNGTHCTSSYSCGSPVNTWTVNCGKTTSTIESATIVFK